MYSLSRLRLYKRLQNITQFLIFFNQSMRKIALNKDPLRISISFFFKHINYELHIYFIAQVNCSKLCYGETSISKMNVTLVQEHIPVFILNGYEDLELFRELEAADLDYLRIHQPEDRAKILTAVQLLHDLQCEYTEQTGYIYIIHGSLKTFSSSSLFVLLHISCYN